MIIFYSVKPISRNWKKETNVSYLLVLVSRKWHMRMVWRRQFNIRCSAPPIDDRFVGEANRVTHVNCKSIRTHIRSRTSILSLPDPSPYQIFLKLVEKCLLELTPHLSREPNRVKVRWKNIGSRSWYKMRTHVSLPVRLKHIRVECCNCRELAQWPCTIRLLYYY